MNTKPIFRDMGNALSNSIQILEGHWYMAFHLIEWAHHSHNTWNSFHLIQYFIFRNMVIGAVLMDIGTSRPHRYIELSEVPTLGYCV